MEQIALLLKSGILRRVALTKNNDLDVSFRFCGSPDAGYTDADVKCLQNFWSADELLDIKIDGASDSHESSHLSQESTHPSENES